MKWVLPRSTLIPAIIALLIALTGLGNAGDEILDKVEFHQMPLNDAIRALLGHIHVNAIFDPRVPGSGFDSGRLTNPPAIEEKWTNLTAQEALNKLLAKYQLKMIANPATTVARIVPVNSKAKPVSVIEAGPVDKNDATFVTLDGVPLTNAITILALQAQLKTTIDPAVAAPAFANQGALTVRWEHITARQALAALLDNYGLAMKSDSTGSSLRIILKTKHD